MMADFISTCDELTKVKPRVALRLAFCVVAALLLGSGCASPDTRIREHPALFASFPSAIQEKVRQGHVEVGFTKDMVMLSQGKPDRRVVREDDTGVVSETWFYTDVYYTRVPVYHSHRYHRNRYGDCDSYYFDRAWDDVPHPYDRLTLQFIGNRLASIDRDVRH